MSDRAGITTAYADKIKALLDATGIYVNNVYDNVDTKVTHFDGVLSFPYISVTPGPETRDDMPSNFSWSNLTMYIRIYVRNTDDAQGELESLITDIENVLDTNLNISYNVTTFQGVVARETATNTITTITTDEGILDPDALGEIVVNVQYEKLRAF